MTQITFTFTDSPLGRLLVAATHNGVCTLYIGDNEATLETALTHTFADSMLIRDDAAMQHWVDILLQYLNGKRQHLDIPVDVQGTDFQQRVWDTLRTIPYGETRSYSEIANQIQHPKAVRAVANACGSNPVPLIIPCHRVVRSDGSLGGYGSGIERKQALLEMEKHTIAH